MTNLSGWWVGTYSYRSRLEPTWFDAELRDSNGLLTGIITENGDSVRSAGMVLQATIVGEIANRSITFTKIYDDIVRSHSVFYDGQVVEDDMAIEGTWRITATWFGPFRMERRTARIELSEEVRQTAPVD